MPDFSVPTWLQPPSESERRRLEIMEEQVRAKATSMLRKSVGLARMQDEAAKLAATGMDELTARKKALLDNASLIFADEPEAMARMIESEEANRIRERSAIALEKWREAQAEGIEGRLELMGKDLERKEREFGERMERQDAALGYKYDALDARIANQERLAALRERSQAATEDYRKAQQEHQRLSLEERKDHNIVMESLRERALESTDLYNNARLEIEKQKREFEGRFLTATNPVTGKVEAVWQGSPGRQQLVREPNFALDSSVKKAEARAIAIKRFEDAKASGDPKAIEEARLYLESIEHAQGYNDPTYEQRTALKALYDRKNEIEKDLTLYKVGQRTPQAEALIKAMEDQLKDIDDRIKKITARRTDVQPPVPPSTNTLGTNAVNIGRFRAKIH